MANNRMLLIHRPTGLAVVLAKHSGWGWYKEPKKGLLELLYAEVQAHTYTVADMEDFCIGMESCEAETPFVNTDWHRFDQDDSTPELLQVNEVPPVIREPEPVPRHTSLVEKIETAKKKRGELEAKRAMRPKAV